MTSPNAVQSDTTQLNWSGQGAPVNQKCSPADPGAGGFQNGATAGNYELWIFSTDGGSVQAPPTLTINGTTYGNAYKPGASDNQFGFQGAWQIVTPYIDPASITPQSSAFTNFVVNTTGNGSWVLTISHGCNSPNVPPAQAPRVQKNAAGAYDTKWTWTITKSVDQSEIDQAPGAGATFNYTVQVNGQSSNSNVVVTGTITASNPNGAPVDIGPPSNTVDQLSDGTNCSLTNPPVNNAGDVILQPGDNPLGYSCSLPDNSNMSGLTNTVTINWNTQTLSDGSVLQGGNAQFTTPNVIVFTQGKNTDNCATVTDPNAPAGALGQVCSGQLDGSGNYTFPSYQVTYNTQGNPDPAGTCTKHDNTATVTGNDSGASSKSSADVKVCVGADLTVTKTATPSFDRTYTWGITKAVDQSVFRLPSGTATANYTVSVTHDSGTDSNWQVNGTIHVANPNDWESMALTGVTDAIDNGGTCSITSGNQTATLAPKGQPGDSADLGYQCIYGSQPDYAALFTNTATASWSQSAANTADGSAQGTATGHFSDAKPTIHDGSVTVNDTQDGNLGTVTYTDPSPEALTYSKIFNVPPSGCQSFPNTATFTTSDSGKTGSASQTVQVCRTPLQTGALTMGYWQNKNGQAQILNANASSLSSFLRGYNPYQDLSATATSTQIASYVNNIIKAANASGASMNAMLRAQMLSTALSVYFKTSIGTTPIDLTQVCTNPTACTSFEDASPAFSSGHETVNQMLTDASNAATGPTGMTNWYKQVKSTQQLAKDAFDAVNNQVAFGP